MTDRFNLTGLNTEVQYYQYALDLVTDVFELDCDDEMRDQIEKSARHLYGLVHARYITTTRGLSKMVSLLHAIPMLRSGASKANSPVIQLDKYKKGEFGKCPRVHCSATHLLPTGLSDVPGVQFVKLYCPKCEDIYNPKSSRHASIDGAYFGTSFQNILFQVYPALVPEKTSARYEPKVFGFKVHAAAALQRWQEDRKEEMLGRLKGVGIENVFADEEAEPDEEDDDEEGMDLGEDL